MEQTDHDRTVPKISLCGMQEDTVVSWGVGWFALRETYCSS